ncbi:MAG: hypothetical protein M1828_004762 [Chrysothrix sp. TS-e1954]|nr:MAG: hypothetical protein M1828_004762 [Chrysothrix sp. TS-e1954]
MASQLPLRASNRSTSGNPPAGPVTDNLATSVKAASNIHAFNKNSIPAWGNDHSPPANGFSALNETNVKKQIEQEGENMTVLSRVFALEARVVNEINELKSSQITLNKEVEKLKTVVSPADPNKTMSNILAPGDMNHPSADAGGDLNRTSSVLSAQGTTNYPVSDVGVTHPTNNVSENTAVDESSNSPATSSTEINMPHYIQTLPPPSLSSLANHPLPVHSMQTFSHAFLTTHLGGEEWSPGFFANSPHLPSLLGKARHVDLKPSKSTPGKPSNIDLAALKAQQKGTGTTYYIIETSLQPYAPSSPGAHGALVAAFLHDFEESGDRYKDVPVFISAPPSPGTTPSAVPKEPEKRYIYIGSYTQSRWSDRLSSTEYHRLLPPPIRQSWARLLANPDRPAWLSEVLRAHLAGPRPPYEGVVPAELDKAGLWKRVVEADVKTWMGELREWEADADAAVQGLTVEGVKRLMERSDCDESPGVRFWWEYLECVGFERNFYYALASAARACGGGYEKVEVVRDEGGKPGGVSESAGVVSNGLQHQSISRPREPAGGTPQDWKDGIARYVTASAPQKKKTEEEEEEPW